MRNVCWSILPTFVLGGMSLALGYPPDAPRTAPPPPADPAKLLWYTHPADKWENALPVGNGRLGAMVFGRTSEEEIQLNEDTL